MSGGVTRTDRDGVAELRLERPESRNAVNTELLLGLREHLQAIQDDASTRAVIVAAAGPAFCAGADLSRGMSAEPQAPRDVLYWYESERDGQRRHQLFRDLGKPIVAAVQGHAVAWGLELACLCDFIIASERAQFGAPAIRHGSMIGTLLPWLVGVQNARYLLYSGDTIDAQEAFRMGLAFRVVPHVRLADEAQRFARRLAMIPPLALKLNKRQLDGVQDMAGMGNGLKYGALAAALCHSMQDTAETPDGRNLAAIRREEGMKAFLEARDAPYRE